MNDILFLSLGITLGGILALGSVLSLYNNSPVDKKIRAINDMIAECEKSLPRNVSCELVAKPKEIIK